MPQLWLLRSYPWIQLMSFTQFSNFTGVCRNQAVQDASSLTPWRHWKTFFFLRRSTKLLFTVTLKYGKWLRQPSSGLNSPGMSPGSTALCQGRGLCLGHSGCTRSRKALSPAQSTRSCWWLHYESGSRSKTLCCGQCQALSNRHVAHFCTSVCLWGNMALPANTLHCAQWQLMAHCNTVWS